MNDDSGSGNNRFLDMEKIEPAEGDPRGEGGTGRLLNLCLEAAHPSEATENRLPDDAAQTEGEIAFGIRKMIEAPSVLVPSGIMLKKVTHGEDAEFSKRCELGSPDPSQTFQRSLGIMGRLSGDRLCL